MSGAQTSTFGDPNILYKALSGAGTAEVQRNQLLNQEATQQINTNDMEQVSRAANYLQTLPAEQRPAAYQTVRSQLQNMGFAKTAPAQYPGDDVIGYYARMGTPSQTQAEWGANIAANRALSGAGNAQPAPGTPGTPGTPAAPATAYGAGGPGANVQVPAEYMPYFQEASQRTGIPVDLLIAQARQESGFNPGATGGAGEIGIMQVGPGTATSPGFGMSGVPNPAVLRDPRTNINFGADYLAARAKAIGADLNTPDGQARALAAYNGGGDPNYVRNVTRYMPTPGGGTAVARTTTTPAGGGPVIIGDSLASSGGLGGSGTVGAQPNAVLSTIQNGAASGAYRGKDVVLSSGASNGPGDLASVEGQLKALRDAGSVTLLGVGPGVEAKAPGTNAKLQQLAAQYGARFQPLPTDQMSPDGVHPTGAGYATLKAAVAPAQGDAGGNAAPARYQVASNAPVAPPTATTPPAPPPVAQNALTPPAPQPPAATPATGPRLPVLGTDGLTDQQRAQLDALGQTGRMTGQQRLAAQTQFQQNNIALQEKLFSEWMQTQQLATSQGQLNVSQANSALEYWKAAHPDAKVTMTGGEIITQDPRSGQEIAPRIQVTPQRADTAAMAIVSRLGPKVANGTATPEEQSQYAVAVDSYRQPTLRENPVTKETVRVNTRELPAGFPEPPAPGGSAGSGGAASGSGGGAGGGGPQVVMPGYSPAQQAVEQNPAAYKVSESQYDRDSKEIAGISDAGRMAQADQIRINEMQDVLQRFSSGPGTEWRTAASSFLQRWLPSAVTGWEKESANLSGAQAAQAFAKLAVTGAGSQERSVLGNRGGFQAIKMFSAANPNVDLQDATNKSILDMQLISNQANQDYSQGAQQHFAENEKSFGGPTHQYNSLAQFDTQWNAQRNPQVYAGAMGAISGQPASQWAKGLSDDEYTRALQIVQRAKPSAVVQTKNGPYSMQPNAVTGDAQPKSGDTVIRFDHNGNRIQ